MASATYSKAVRAATEAHGRSPCEESIKAVIEAYERLASSDFYTGETQQSTEDYQQCLRFSREYWRLNPEDPVRKRLLALNYAGLGDLELDDLHTGDALKSYQSALEVFGGAQDGTTENDKTLANLNIRLASALTELGSQSEALVNLRKAVAIAERLGETSPSDKAAQRFKLVTYSYIIAPLVGTDTLNVGHSEQGHMYAHKILAIAEALAADDKKNVGARYDLAFGYEAKGELLRLIQPVIASRWYRKSIAVTKEAASRAPGG